jgi:terminase small subunit-like protein
MAALSNPQREQFCQLVAAGHSPARAYGAAGYSEKTAYTAGPRLLKVAGVSARVAELQQTITHATVNRAVVDRDWVLSGLRKIAENGASESARVRALELCGRELGMFADRSIPWDGDPNKLTDEQLQKFFTVLAGDLAGSQDPAAIEGMKRQLAIEAGVDPADVMDAKFEQVETRQTLAPQLRAAGR